MPVQSTMLLNIDAVVCGNLSVGMRGEKEGGMAMGDGEVGSAPCSRLGRCNAREDRHGYHCRKGGEGVSVG